MKKIFPLTIVAFAIAISSCDSHEEVQKDLPCSYELGATGHDTFNIMDHGLKQGMWIEKHNGEKDTVYYRNDTLL